MYWGLRSRSGTTLYVVLPFTRVNMRVLAQETLGSGASHAGVLDFRGC